MVFGQNYIYKFFEMIHEEKITAIADVPLKNKILEAAFNYAKGVQLGTIATTNGNVKRFSQIVLKDIPAGGPGWVDGLSYFILSTAAALQTTATQAQVTTEMVTVFPHFAKTWYGDIT